LGGYELAEVEDHDSTLDLLLVLDRLGGRPVRVERQLETGPIAFVAAAVIFLTTPDLVDDEWREHLQPRFRGVRSLQKLELPLI